MTDKPLREYVREEAKPIAPSFLARKVYWAQFQDKSAQMAAEELTEVIVSYGLRCARKALDFWLDLYEEELEHRKDQYGLNARLGSSPPKIMARALLASLKEQ